MAVTAMVGEAPNVGDRGWPGELGFVLFFGIETERAELGASMPFIPPPTCAGSQKRRWRPRDVSLPVVVSLPGRASEAEMTKTKTISSSSYLSATKGYWAGSGGLGHGGGLLTGLW
jgi:hypothetical protein